MIGTSIGCHARAEVLSLLMDNLVMSIRKCGVYFCLHEQDDGSMEWPSLQGPDKIKLLKQLPSEFSNCQPAEMVEDVQKLWKVGDRM